MMYYPKLSIFCLLLLGGLSGVGCSRSSVAPAEEVESPPASNAATSTDASNVDTSASSGEASIGSGSASPIVNEPVVNEPAVIQQAEIEPAITESIESGGETAGVFYPSDITDLILVTGQSNALGADTGFDPLRDEPNKRAFAYTNEGWQVADLHQIWDLNWHPRNDPDTDPSNNFGFQFARKIAERKPQKVIGFVLVTAPGMAISHWDYESEFYLKIRNKVVAAINELPHKSSVDGILWHQGESDWDDNDAYRQKLAALINNFRGENWFGADRPFICGETVEAPLNRILMDLNSDGDPWTGCVEAQDLATILDYLHFSAEGLRILGARYATKYLQMTAN